MDAMDASKLALFFIEYFSIHNSNANIYMHILDNSNQCVGNANKHLFSQKHSIMPMNMHIKEKKKQVASLLSARCGWIQNFRPFPKCECECGLSMNDSKCLCYFITLTSWMMKWTPQSALELLVKCARLHEIHISTIGEQMNLLEFAHSSFESKWQITPFFISIFIFSTITRERNECVSCVTCNILWLI